MREVPFDYILNNFNILKGKKIMVYRDYPPDSFYQPEKIIGYLSEISLPDNTNKPGSFTLTNVKWSSNLIKELKELHPTGWAEAEWYKFFSNNPDLKIYLSEKEEMQEIANERQKQKALGNLLETKGFDENASKQISSEFMIKPRGGKRSKVRHSNRKCKTKRLIKRRNKVNKNVKNVFS